MTKFVHLLAALLIAMCGAFWTLELPQGHTVPFASAFAVTSAYGAPIEPDGPATRHSAVQRSRGPPVAVLSAATFNEIAC